MFARRCVRHNASSPLANKLALQSFACTATSVDAAVSRKLACDAHAALYLTANKVFKE